MSPEEMARRISEHDVQLSRRVHREMFDLTVAAIREDVKELQQMQKSVDERWAQMTRLVVSILATSLITLIITALFFLLERIP